MFGGGESSASHIIKPPVLKAPHDAQNVPQEPQEIDKLECVCDHEGM